MKGYIEGLTTNYIKVVCEGNEEFDGKIIKVLLKEAV